MALSVVKFSQLIDCSCLLENHLQIILQETLEFKLEV